MYVRIALVYYLRNCVFAAPFNIPTHTYTFVNRSGALVLDKDGHVNCLTRHSQILFYFFFFLSLTTSVQMWICVHPHQTY